MLSDTSNRPASRCGAWGINFLRSVRRKNEDSLWTGWKFNQGLFRLQNAGLLVGISDVAQACGYSDHSAFTRQFRATVGLTPTAFRRAFR